jgi:hypothetical protein
MVSGAKLQVLCLELNFVFKINGLRGRSECRDSARTVDFSVYIPIFSVEWLCGGQLVFWEQIVY